VKLSNKGSCATKRNNAGKKLMQHARSIPTFTGTEIVSALDELYPEVKTPLKHSNVFQLLIATVLSAQCTDAQVNRVTPSLFARFPDAYSLSKANLRELESLIKSTGFYHVKARRIKEISSKLVSNYKGRVPKTMEELLTLPGIGRKTANIVLSAGYGVIEGIAVDTHVFRLSRRIGLSESKTPEKIELDLMKITPDREIWPRLATLLIFHGRRICFARHPNCEACPLSIRCSYFAETRKTS
jgi:endonuclease III